MANVLTDLMQTTILPMALPVLRENSIMAALVNRDLSGVAAEKNETIRVPLPQNFGDARDVDPVAGTTSTDLDDGKVDVKLDQWKYQQFQMNDREMREVTTTAVLPSAVDAAVKSLANTVDKTILNAALAGVYNHTGTPGTTPNSVAAVRGGRKILNANLAPMSERYNVLGNDAEDAIGGIDNLIKANEAGDTTALREGSIGRIGGIQHFLDTNIDTSIGVFTQTDITALLVNGAVAAGAETMDVDGGTPTTGVMRVGDLFSVAGVDGSFVITADSTLAAGAATGVTFAPAAPAGGFADNAAITFVRDAGASVYANNLMFHRNAFTFAQRPLSEGETGQSESSSIAQMTDPISGISLRMETWREPGKKTRFWCFDVLFAAAVLRPELAVRFLG